MVPNNKTIFSLADVKQMLDARERKYLSPSATPSGDAIRRVDEVRDGHRQAFATDADRILHSRAYTRYIDKTQVFYLVDNDHITHRVLHVQLVSKIARTIGRFLGLNEDLIEAIALGHDIGHPPFGHDGEKVLSRLCIDQGLPAFQHNVQSVLFLDKIEKKGKGCNLTLQVLDGILCHDGEVHAMEIHPERISSFAELDAKMYAKAENPKVNLVPMSLEGCVVRFCDTIAYIGRDIEDAIELNLINRGDIPEACARVLGNTNGKIVYRLVEDLIAHTLNINTANNELGVIGFSKEVANTLAVLKKFNYKNIYMNPKIKMGFDKITKCYEALFSHYLKDITERSDSSAIYSEFLSTMDSEYLDANKPAAMVRDFMAGMTDDYFLHKAVELGCEVPDRL